MTFLFIEVKCSVLVMLRLTLNFTAKLNLKTYNLSVQLLFSFSRKPSQIYKRRE